MISRILFFSLLVLTAGSYQSSVAMDGKKQSAQEISNEVLPDEVWLHIVNYLRSNGDIPSLLSLRQVSIYFEGCLSDGEIFKLFGYTVPQGLPTDGGIIWDNAQRLPSNFLTWACRVAGPQRRAALLAELGDGQRDLEPALISALMDVGAGEFPEGTDLTSFLETLIIARCDGNYAENAQRTHKWDKCIERIVQRQPNIKLCKEHVLEAADIILD